MDDIREALAIIIRDGRVLALKPEPGVVSNPWRFPACRLNATSVAKDILQQMVSETLGIKLSTMWLLDSVAVRIGVEQKTIDCYVCSPLPTQQGDSSSATMVQWLDRDGLALTTWETGDADVARMVGMYWDQIFGVEHL